MRLRATAAALLVLVAISVGGTSATADLPPAVMELNKAPLRVFPRRQLGFGDLLPGISVTVDITDPSAARWLILGTAGAEVDLTFLNLPAQLSDGSNDLSVAYGSASAGFHARNRPANAIRFDPAQGTLTRLHPLTGHLIVWIGGTALPTSWQSPGAYQADITLDVTYTGN